MTLARRSQQRSASLKRRRHVREPERRFHIYCEGVRTEPAYFRAIEGTFGRVQLEVNPVGGDPWCVADRAIGRYRENRQGRRSSFEKKDQVWAVFDRDTHERFAGALDRCRQVGVCVAASFPCFELWLVLHFELYDRPAGSLDVQRRLHELFPAYHHRRAPGPDFHDLLDALEEAERRARQQLRSRREERKPFSNPSTTMVCLIGAIREAQRQATNTEATSPERELAVRRFLEARAAWRPTGMSREEIQSARHQGHRF